MMAVPAIELRKVSARYQRTPVLEGLSLEIAAGEMVGILGPNGAGKSTLFAVLSGLLPPATGSVALFGSEVRKLPPRERARTVAVVPQDLDIPVSYTVEELVTMGRLATMGRFANPQPEDRHSIERALVYTDVADIRDRPVNELSGGERQRAIVAMALAREPRIILLDEATSHLDLNHRLEIMQLVERLNRENGVTVLMISHDLQNAAEFSQRLVLLDHGRLVADGLPASVLTEDTLRQVYHCDVRVSRSAEGGLSILSAPRLPAPAAGRGIRIHVVGGGGTGEPILRRLALCGYTVTSGVLNRGDQDATIAGALGIATILEKPFSHIGADALGQARILARQADALVLGPTPFGTGNLPNLDLLGEALATGRPVFIWPGIEERDYTPAREAVTRVQALLRGGATACHDIAELLARLPRATQG